MLLVESKLYIVDPNVNFGNLKVNIQIFDISTHYFYQCKYNHTNKYNILQK